MSSFFNIFYFCKDDQKCGIITLMKANLYLSDISAYYGKKLVLKNVSVNIPQAELTCLCGPNGCGKSTLLTILAGAASKEPQLKTLQGVKRKSGSKTLANNNSINAMELEKLPRKKTARIVSYMQQSEYSTWNFTVKELVLQGRFCHTKNGFYTNEDEELAQEAMEELQILSLAQRPVHSLSGGEFQKARIARALCQAPDFILLDEPAANLDFVYEPWLMKKLSSLAHSKNTGILISIHDVNLAAGYADQLILLPLLEQAICGKIEEILTTENLKKTYGMEFECQKVNYFQSLL